LKIFIINGPNLNLLGTREREIYGAGTFDEYFAEITSSYPEKVDEYIAYRGCSEGVIIEDGAFIGSRCILVEGVRIGKEAVLGANVTLTSSSKIIDVTGPEPVEYKGYVPERSVVVPGSISKKFPAGEYNINCALIIGKRKASTDLKTSLNDALRKNNVSV